MLLDHRRRRVAYRERAFALEWPLERAYVLLEDGARFDGDAVAAAGPITGEVVFTTGMSGYQESVTDPSFTRRSSRSRIPTSATTGCSAEAMESEP